MLDTSTWLVPLADGSLVYLKSPPRIAKVKDSNQNDISLYYDMTLCIVLNSTYYLIISMDLLEKWLKEKAVLSGTKLTLAINACKEGAVESVNDLLELYETDGLKELSLT